MDADFGTFTETGEPVEAEPTRHDETIGFEPVTPTRAADRSGDIARLEQRLDAERRAQAEHEIAEAERRSAIEAEQERASADLIAEVDQLDAQLADAITASDPTQRNPRHYEARVMARSFVFGNAGAVHLRGIADPELRALAECLFQLQRRLERIAIGDVQATPDLTARLDDLEHTAFSATFELAACVAGIVETVLLAPAKKSK